MGFISHWQFLEPAAVNNGISLVTQGLEIDVVCLVDQVTDIPALGFHIGKIRSFVSDLLKINIPVILVTPVAGLLTP